jgi:hypothetical protein
MRIRAWTSERAYRELLRQHNVSHVADDPAEAVRAGWGARRSAQSPNRDLEREADFNGGRMDPEAWARWTFLVTEHRRSALAIATLARSIFRDEHRPREVDLVSLMAGQASDAELKNGSLSTHPIRGPEIRLLHAWQKEQSPAFINSLGMSDLLRATHSVIRPCPASLSVCPPAQPSVGYRAASSSSLVLPHVMQVWVMLLVP